MNNSVLTTVALRYHAVFLNIDRDRIDMDSMATAPVMAFNERLRETGFCVSEELLHALNSVSVNELADITSTINTIMGVDLNWAPLVKNWKVPTGESLADHIITFFANIFGKEAGFKGTTLPCGHLIPDGTFPLERYNGCPFCGKPFKTSDFVYRGQGSKLKELRLFTPDDMNHLLESLLTSATPLDESQKNSLELLLGQLELPREMNVTMKETAMLVINLLVKQGKDEEAVKLLKTPNDILRYLWYEKTGYVQIIEPKTLVAHSKRLYAHIWEPLDRSQDAAIEMKKKLKLKYNRRTCRRIAAWMNALDMTTEQAAENMNPKRSMWVQFIRALRLGEYSRKKEFEHLAEILDVFYRGNYETWQGQVDKAISKNDANQVLALLQKRPGSFARCLFATMLRFGSKPALDAFNLIADKLPARLVLSLANAAETYFDPNVTRLVRPITGVHKMIEPNKLLVLYSEKDREKMVNDIDELYKSTMTRRFAATRTDSRTIYIDPQLYNIPLSVGDRTTTIQDSSCALMGTRFAVEGDTVRLFLQWGKGLHAQPLDMDLSCRITMPNYKIEECAYYNLTCVGAKHSGDIRTIPEMVGTAEYVELNLTELEEAGALYAVFTCNAYSVGSLSPNLVVGWMNSANPMTVSEETGVAYDPSCVQHMVRISEGNLSKGLVFGILIVAKREIVWLEMPFTAQNLRGADQASIEALLKRLENKTTVGELLDLKAEAQSLTRIDEPTEADEAYTLEWAFNPADVTKLLNQ